MSLDEFHSFNKSWIYLFEYENGGMGDYLKFYLCALDFSWRNKRKLYLSVHHPLNQFISLKDDRFYANNIDHLPKVHSLADCDLNSETCYILTVFCFYFHDDLQKIINKWKWKEIFRFSDIIVEKGNEIIGEYKNYISVHIRLGDKYIETDDSHKACHDEVRPFNQTALYNFLENNQSESIFLFCDNNSFKMEIKAKFPFIRITNYPIGHTSYKNSSEEIIKNCVIDFYILCHSSKIVCSSSSGFSFMASKYNNIDLSYL